MRRKYEAQRRSIFPNLWRFQDEKTAAYRALERTPAMATSIFSRGRPVRRNSAEKSRLIPSVVRARWVEWELMKSNRIPKYFVGLASASFHCRSGTREEFDQC